MKTIALWSRDHIMAARILIAVCHILMSCLALYMGRELQKNYVLISPTVFWFFIALFLIITTLFSKSYTTFRFYKRKLLDGLILLCSFIIMVSFANQNRSGSFLFYQSLQGSFVGKKAKISKIQTKPSIKELKKQLKELRKAVKKGEGASAGGIILAILAAAGLGLLLASAACSLSCNGHDALAIFLLIGGVTAIFFICRLIIRATEKKGTVSIKPVDK